MGADLGVPLSNLRLLCVSVAGGESRKTFTQFSKRENVKTSVGGRDAPPELPYENKRGPHISCLRLLCGSIDGWGGESRNVHPIFYT